MSQIVKEPLAAEHADQTSYPGLAQVKSIIAFASAKGGTGKSTMVANFAAALALKGRKIGIADADFDAPSIAPMLGLPRVRLIGATGAVEPANGPFGIRIVANDPAADEPPPNFALDDLRLDTADSPLVRESEEFTSLHDLIARARFGPLDLLLIDLPPGFKHAMRLCESIERAGVVVVLPASATAAGAVRRSLEQARRKGVRILGLIENMQGFYCGNCHSVRPLLPRSDIGALARDFDLPILGRFPFDSRLAESCDTGRPFVREYPDAPVSKLINEAAQALFAAASAPVAAPPS
ncbi:MAG TPA: P-loop NTPase [Candidatus Binataceae bacterium]|jgi:ATP-binding protein involved in chromosome partitioning|nr:P-loop NTPase [Candidatus Binataceae bacterium]